MPPTHGSPAPPPAPRSLEEVLAARRAARAILTEAGLVDGEIDWVLADAGIDGARRRRRRQDPEESWRSLWDAVFREWWRLKGKDAADILMRRYAYLNEPAHVEALCKIGTYVAMWRYDPTMKFEPWALIKMNTAIIDQIIRKRPPNEHLTDDFPDVPFIAGFHDVELRHYLDQMDVLPEVNLIHIVGLNPAEADERLNGSKDPRRTNSLARRANRWVQKNVRPDDFKD